VDVFVAPTEEVVEGNHASEEVVVVVDWTWTCVVVDEVFVDVGTAFVVVCLVVVELLMLLLGANAATIDKDAVNTRSDLWKYM
jgi:hypothetical protein